MFNILIARITERKDRKVKKKKSELNDKQQSTVRHQNGVWHAVYIGIKVR